MPAIAVRVSVKKLIDALNAKIASAKKIIAAQEKAQEDHEKAQEKFKSTIAKFVKAGTKPQSASVNRHRWDTPHGFVKIELEYFVPATDVPEEPKMEHAEGWQGSLDEQVKEMENAVRLLQMTDEEYVNTSTYKSVSKYL